MPEPAQKPKYTKRTITYDILSATSVIYLIIICPIWSHYIPDKLDPNKPWPLMLDLEIADIFPAVVSAIWLVKRYNPIRTLHSVKFRALVVAGLLASYLIGYLILKNTLWR